MKKRSIIFYAAMVFAVALIILGIVFVVQGRKSFEVSDPQKYLQYISAYSGDVISKHDKITVHLNSDFAETLTDKKTDLFEFKPRIKGEMVWESDNIVSFIPEEPLESGKKYAVRFRLNRLNKNIPSSLESFVFNVHTKIQDFYIEIDEIITTDLQNFTKQDLIGTIRLMDYEEQDIVSQLIEVKHGNNNPEVTFEKLPDNSYRFIVKDIERTNTESEVRVFYNGKILGRDKSGSINYSVPALDDFVVLDVKTMHFPEQHAKIVFSDPVKENQLLTGLISIRDSRNVKYIVSNNTVRVIPERRLDRTHVLNIYTGVQNIHGKKLSKDYSADLNFRLLNPELAMVGEGVILPTNTQGLVMPFKAVNIRAVDVRVIKIFENNILQFLQDNELSGQFQINKVGKLVKAKTVSLQTNDIADLNKWNTYSISLEELIEPDPGAIYRIEIGFRKENSIYPCYDDDDEITIHNNMRIIDIPDGSMDWFTNYTYSSVGYGFGYDYASYQNPCSENYYGYRRAIKLNVLASDIGLIAKKGTDNKMHVFATDLVSAKAQRGMKIELFNYQQQVVAEGKTNRDGYIAFEIPDNEEVSFVVATNTDNNQKGYLKTFNYQSLSTSAFDVAGEYHHHYADNSVFMFTERGVYRPGDSIYLGVIFKHNLNLIPLGHPVVLEITNPRGQEIYREVQAKNQENFNVFRFKTELDDITGYYYAKLSVGSQQFSKPIMVETIKPNRLNIDFNLDKEYLTGDGTVTANIFVKWLHGAVGQNLDNEVTMTIIREQQPFTDFKNYNFYNNVHSVDFSTISILKDKTDEKGEINKRINFSGIKNAPGVLRANLLTKVFEQGGNFSISESSFTYSPYKHYVGLYLPDRKKYPYSLPVNRDLKLDIVVLDRDGKLASGQRELELSVYEIDHSWWYDYEDNKVDFISANYNNAITRRTFYSNNGKAEDFVSFQVDGNYLIAIKDKKDGHISAQRIYASQYAYSASSEMHKSAEILSFTSDKLNYEVGEDVVVKIPAGDGRALVSIENSSRVLKTFWVDVDTDNHEFKFKATEEMAPNVYVNVTFLQPHNQTTNDRPIRMYGIIPIMVENPHSKLEPIINMADELLAESKVDIRISEKNNQPMTYTLAIVDEGLLSLTRFRTPSPWNFFYSKESLGVSTWDLFKYVIGMHSISASRVLTIGGGEGLSPEAMLQAIRFKPMVKFIGPVQLEAGKENLHQIQLPQYIGAVRTMVVAAHGNAYGNAEKTTEVKKPLMILGSAPRLIGTEEEMLLPVNVFAMNPNVRDVTVSVKTNEHFEIIGGNAKNIKFDKEGSQLVEFKLRASKTEGIGEINITAVSGARKAEYDIEMDVRHPNPLVSDMIDLRESNNEYSAEFSALGIKGTNSAYLEIYSIPPMNLEKRIQYLISYPHGCLEQIISAAFPQLYLHKFIDLNDDEKQKIQTAVARTIQLLSRYQLPNGGFSYWPGNNNIAEWVTNYAGHFMLSAENAGYEIPANMKLNWVNHQKTRASRWNDDGRFSQISQAYRLYTLALAGSPDAGAMNRLRNINTNTATKWRLALAYSESENTNIAKQMVEGLTTEIAEYTEFAGSFGSAVRDKAMILETLINLNEREKAFMILRDIADHIGSDRYASTQTIAYSLLSAAKFVEKFGQSGEIDCSYEFNGKTFSAKTSSPVFRQKLNINENSKNSITVKNNTDDVVFVRLIRTGIPEKGFETAAQSNIRMNVRYTFLNGNVLNPSRIIQGTDVIAEVKLRNVSNYRTLENVALTQIFPPGWEIVNQRMYATELGETSYYEYQDIRDDRVLTYFTMVKGQDYVFKVLLNANFVGRYYLPSVSAETMYDGSNYARTTGQWVEVTKN